MIIFFNGWAAFYNLIRCGALLLLFTQTDAIGKDMSFHMLYMMQTNTVVADGDIVASTPEKFKEFLDANQFDGSIRNVALNSNGGNLIAGLKLGRMIRKNSLGTTVAKYPYVGKNDPKSHDSMVGGCFSSCAFAFIGGQRRFMETGSRLGFHQFSSSKSLLESNTQRQITQAAAQLIGADILEYIVAMDINPLLYSKLSRALPDEMFSPDTETMRNYNILTKTEFDRFNFEPYKNGVISFSEFPENATGRNVVGQITFYCRKSVPHLLLSLSKGSQPLSKKFLEELETSQDGFQINSGSNKKEYDSGNVRTRVGGLAIAEIKLDRSGAQLLTDGAFGSIKVGAVNGIYSFETKPDEFDKRKISSSFKLCID